MYIYLMPCGTISCWTEDSVDLSKLLCGCLPAVARLVEGNRGGVNEAGGMKVCADTRTDPEVNPAVPLQW